MLGSVFNATGSRGALVPGCLTPQRQARRRETPGNWGFVLPVSLVSANLKIILIVQSGENEFNARGFFVTRPPVLGQLRLVQSRRTLAVGQRGRDARETAETNARLLGSRQSWSLGNWQVNRRREVTFQSNRCTCKELFPSAFPEVVSETISPVTHRRAVAIFCGAIGVIQ
jgi:hypothetical protein